jgi:hypothetical protein
MQEVQLASQPIGAGDVHQGRHDTGAPATEGRRWGGSREGHLQAHAPSWEPWTQGPRPDDTLELRGKGGGHKQATVETTLKVRDEHEPGDYLCVAIQAYDSQGNMVMIENPKPTKIFRIVDLGNKDDHKMEFLGWGED